MTIPEWLQHQENVFLLIALLLALWLWLLVSRREQEGKEVHRRTPLSPNELGRTAFAVARSNDLQGYRSLFLNAMEAREKLGPVAEQYMEKRSVEVLRGAFGRLMASIPIGAIYVGINEEEKSRVVIVIRLQDQSQQSLSIGTVTWVGSALRLLEPD